MQDEPSSIDPPPSTKTPRSADDLLKGLRKVLAGLMHSDALERGDVDAALLHLTEVSAQVLRVERTSVWRFQADGAELRCVDLYQRASDSHSSGVLLSAKERPRYFAALAEERSIAAHDARRDPRTREFTADYLEPLGITAMLDAPVFLQGELVGVVCHEHIGQGPRAWLPWEELAAGSFADFMGMVLGAAVRHEQAIELERYRSDLERLVEERTERLRQSEASVRSLFHASPVALMLTRAPRGGLLAINRRASSLLGLPLLPEGTSERPAPQLFCRPEERDRLLETVIAEGRVDHFESQLFRGDGTPFWADVAAQSLTFEGVPSVLFGIHDVTAQKDIEEQLRELATTDPLTATLNRRSFFEAAEEELARSTRYGRSMSLAMLDADHFKGINDAFGHATGDLALAHLATTLKRELRRADVVGRYGGEEFVVLLPETTLAAAASTMERLRAIISGRPPRHEGAPIPLTVSIGVVERRAAEPLAELLRRADAAVYAAKAEGRDRVVAPR